MKLKKLLCGVTAAIMALSSVAIASFTSASADTDTVPYSWTGKWQKEKGLTDAGTTVGGMKVESWGDNWQLKVSGFDLSGMTNPSIKVEVTDDTYQVYTTDWKTSFAEGVKSGVASLITDKTVKELLVMSNGSGVITKVEIYDEKNPAPTTKTENISTIQYNFTVTSGGNTTVTFTDGSSHSASVAVTDSGDYSAKITVNASSIQNVGFIEVPAGDSVGLTVNTLLINDKYTLKVDKALTEVSPNNGLANIWNEQGQSEVVYAGTDAYLAGGSVIKLVIGTPPATTEKTTPSTNTPSSDSLLARVYYASADWSVQPNTLEQYGWKPNGDPEQSGVELNITSDGEYTFDLTSLETDHFKGDANGAVVFVIDFIDAMTTHPEMKAELLSITVPDYDNGGTKEVEFDASKLIFGAIEHPKNNNLRLEIQNEYGNTKDNPAIDPTDIYFMMGDTMSVKIKVTDVNKKPVTTASTTKNTPKTTPGKTTRDPKLVAKDKAAAKKAMKQAKITKLTVKSKAKKKINVTWKKVKKAKGYQVQVSAKKNFKKVIFKKFTTKKKITIKNPKIKSKKTYFVRVRAYATYKDKNGKAVKVYSKWNKQQRKVTVK